MHACMHVCMYVCMYVCMHACMHLCMHVCMNCHLQNVSSMQQQLHTRVVYQVKGGSLHIIDAGCSQGGGPVAQVDGLLLCPTPQHHCNPAMQADTT